MTSPGNLDLEAALETLPDEVAKAQEQWHIFSLDREKMEALLYARFKGEDKDRSATDTEIKAMVHADGDRYQAVLAEIKAEANYIRVYERLLSVKKRASLRSAF